MGGAELPAIEAEGIRPDTRGERDLVDQLLIEPRNLEEKRSILFIPVEREKAFHPRLADSRRLGFRRRSGGRAGEGASEECSENDPHAGESNGLWTLDLGRYLRPGFCFGTIRHSTFDVRHSVTRFVWTRPKLERRTSSVESPRSHNPAEGPKSR